MDTRTEAQKQRDTATKAEIGYVPCPKILVIAPTVHQAHEWAHNQGLMTSEIIWIGPNNWHSGMQGTRGAMHVVLHWSHPSFDYCRAEIKDMLRIVEAVPYDAEDDCVVDPAAALRG
jgi:hypothetical protein